ncbi:MAG: hypothetical protein KAS32_08620 [Candidatus Peribacteraceae bacterium]|nr:hypothetical protein [Candidatus Peribacteraceae bacterium]
MNAKTYNPDKVKITVDGVEISLEEFPSSFKFEEPENVSSGEISCVVSDEQEKDTSIFLRHIYIDSKIQSLANSVINSWLEMRCRINRIFDKK